ncbi:hypothetical protein LPJCM8341_24160 [Lactiplantibacillus plantarum subsp. plantarum]|nr:hypothetical protein LPJCM8341_24160 [Lactiplantibacillus plantarum subsp. plantarum]
MTLRTMVSKMKKSTFRGGTRLAIRGQSTLALKSVIPIFTRPTEATCGPLFIVLIIMTCVNHDGW